MGDTKPAPVTERWTYIGRRYDVAEKKLYHAYIDGTGTQMLYAKAVSGPAIGGVYEVPVTRTDTGARVTLNSYTYLAQHQDAERVAQWKLEDLAAQTAKARDDHEKRDAKIDIGEMRLSELSRLMHKQPTIIRRAMLATVIDYLR